MDKSKTNLIIDAVMLIVMLAMTGIGILMKLVLIPGKDSWARYGRSVDLYFLGMDRHEWGTVHLVLGGVFLVLLVLHIVLHWQLILHMYRRLLSGKRRRVLLACIFAVAAVLCATFSLFIKPEVRMRGVGRRHHSDTRPGAVSQQPYSGTYRSEK